MTCSVATTILLAFVVQAHGKKLRANRSTTAQECVDMLVDNLLGKLVTHLQIPTPPSIFHHVSRGLPISNSISWQLPRRIRIFHAIDGEQEPFSELDRMR